MTRIYLLSLPNPFPFVGDFPYLNLLPREIQRKVDKKVRLEDKKRTLFSQLLVRYALAREACIDARGIHITSKQGEKPFWPDRPSIQFNLSHSGAYAAAAVSDLPVGIDVEKIRKVDVTGIARYFSEEEQRYLLSADKDEQLSLFFRLWTQKESYIKYLGEGLAHSLNDFSVYSDSLCYRIRNGNREIQPCRIQTWSFNDYHLSLCSENETSNTVFSKVSWDELDLFWKGYI